jgi:MYXO-CTERM domain-containing protein
MAVPAFLWIAGARAATVITVGPSGDYSTIQAAVNAADAGDTVSVAAGTYEESVVITKTLTLVGAGAKSTILRDELLVIDASSSDLDLSGFTIEFQETGIYADDELSGHDLVFQGIGDGSTSGGGIFATTSMVDLDNCEFRDHDSGNNYGGLFYAYASTVTITNSSFDGGTAQAGGAVYVSNSDVAISSTTFSNNTAREVDDVPRAAAVRQYLGTLALTDVDFSGNRVDGGYGAGIATHGGTTLITRGSFTGGTVTDSYGSAIAVFEGNLTMIDTVVSGNQELYGAATEDADGALFFFGATPPTFALEGVTFEDNFSDEDGSAIRVSTGTGTITGCVFRDNVSADNGGAIYATGPDPISITDSVFTGNTAKNGGAVRFLGDVGWKTGGSVTVSGSTFVANNAIDNGGAVYVRYADSLDLSGNTFEDNEVGKEGGAVFAWTIDDVVLTGNQLDRNAGGAGGAFSGQEIGTLIASQNRFCANLASNTTTSDGGAASLFDVGSGGIHRWTNNTFVKNFADSNGGDLSLLDVVGAEVLHNTFVNGHAEDDGGSVSLRSATTTSDLVFENNIVAWAYEGDGLRTDDNSTHAIEYNDFWMNVENAVGGSIRDSDLSPTNLAVDPQFGHYTDDENCDDDEFWLEDDSPLLDAGDPDGGTDPDGSDPDIGSSGGGDADWTPYEDGDGDGETESEGDCDDANGDVHTGAEDTTGDGIDQNCDGADGIAETDGTGSDDGTGDGGSGDDGTGDGGTGDDTGTADGGSGDGGGDDGIGTVDDTGGSDGGLEGSEDKGNGEGCGCASSQRGTPAAMLLALGSLLALRRRR